MNIILVVIFSGTGLAALALWPVFAKHAQRNFDADAVSLRASPVMSPARVLLATDACVDALPQSDIGSGTVWYMYGVMLVMVFGVETLWATRLLGQSPWAWYVPTFMWCVCCGLTAHRVGPTFAGWATS